MAYRYTSLAARMQVKMNTERVKVLKVIGEQVGQLVVESKLSLDALKIDRVEAELLEMTDYLFAGKVVKHGTVRAQIYYINPDHALKCSSADIPFMLAVDIPGLTPNRFTETQNHVLDVTPDYAMLSQPERDNSRILELKVVAHILVIVSEWIQLDVVTRVDIFPRHN